MPHIPGTTLHLPGDMFYAEPSQSVGHEQKGRRPYIIMSRKNANLQSVVAVPFTSDKDATQVWPAYCIRLPASQVVKDLSYTGEIVNSIALCHQVRILDHSCLKQKIGKLTPTAVIAVQLGLSNLFDIR